MDNADKMDQMVSLNYKKAGEGPALIILHGLFGSLDNWATLARTWANEFTVYQVDLRNHGKSPHTDTHTIPDMAADIIGFIRQHEITNPVLLGHSMGGKVAMEVALQEPPVIRGLIIADIGAQRYPRGHDYIFDAIRSIDLDEMSSRKEIESKLSEFIENEGEVLFMSKNMDRTRDGFKWKINVDTLEQDYEEIIQSIDPGRVFNKPVLLLRGEKSHYVQSKDLDLLKEFFPRIRIEDIAGAGHWLHADNPEAFDEHVRKFMDQL